MARFSAAIPLFALAGLTACATYDDFGTPVASAPTATGAIVAVPSATVTVPAATVTVPAATVPGTAVVAAAPVAVPYRTGYGVIESVSIVRLNPPVLASASAGSSSPITNAYRLSVRMDDGSVQTIDQDNRAFQAGDRIQITSDGHVLRY